MKYFMCISKWELSGLNVLVSGLFFHYNKIKIISDLVNYLHHVKNEIDEMRNALIFSKLVK